MQLFVLATGFSLLVAALLGSDGVPFDRPAVGTTDMVPNLVMQLVQIPVALVLIAVAHLITKRRAPIDFAARAPVAATAKQETVGLLVYGVVVLALARFLGFGMHLHGAIFGATEEVVPGDIYVWAIYNFLFFALIPYLVFRSRGYDHQAMCLRSANRKNDSLLIITVLVLEGIVELATFPDLLSLMPSQLLIGMPVTFIAHLLGTGIPVMIFAYAILFPRYVTLTGSPAAAVVLGAVTYAGLHTFEYWTVYDTFGDAALSISFVFLQFSFPGLIKSFLTLRTGNAWVHLWAYHAIAPHVTVDTPLVVRTFGIR